MDGDISHRLPAAVNNNIADPIDETTGLTSDVPEPETEEDDIIIFMTCTNKFYIFHVNTSPSSRS
jgi:hypothetical protein